MNDFLECYLNEYTMNSELAEIIIGTIPSFDTVADQILENKRLNNSEYVKKFQEEMLDFFIMDFLAKTGGELLSNNLNTLFNKNYKYSDNEVISILQQRNNTNIIEDVIQHGLYFISVEFFNAFAFELQKQFDASLLNEQKYEYCKFELNFFNSVIRHQLSDLGLFCDEKTLNVNGLDRAVIHFALNTMKVKANVSYNFSIVDSGDLKIYELIKKNAGETIIHSYSRGEIDNKKLDLANKRFILFTVDGVFTVKTNVIRIIEYYEKYFYELGIETNLKLITV